MVLSDRWMACVWLIYFAVHVYFQPTLLNYNVWQVGNGYLLWIPVYTIAADADYQVQTTATHAQQKVVGIIGSGAINRHCI